MSRSFGFDRGTPVDRYFIESFLDRHRELVRGAALEVGDDTYLRRFGGNGVTAVDILHIDASSDAATIIGDMSDPATLPEAKFDCLIVTQTLHLVYDMPAAVRNLYHALKPGGTLLMTVPGITPIARDRWKETWYWSVTPAGAGRLFADAFGPGDFRVEFYGNVFAAVAFLEGVATEEVARAKLNLKDESYPVIVAVRATRASAD
ncbi:class I SAM-dependent methyltransferase [Sphingomonas sp. URHD0057]|uniref:class I SAM-dependent methyltransferase n=1 Tax=Sphingomonas sp. URHD0057 TaxID=1380389 RepID=UPI000B02BBD3|nr:methyltransferase domain-containing protein [Sphingomonas sp. URHD0057]